MTSPFSAPIDRSDPTLKESDARLVAVLGLLAETSRLLAASSDLRCNLDAVARSLVPACFAWCRIDLDDGSAPIGITAPDDEHGPRFRVALMGRRAPIGFLTVGIDPENAALDRAIADEIAARIASFVVVSQALAREHAVADTLQRALLPESFPSAEGVHFSAAYDPAASEAIVGGDWYDAFALPDGRIAVSIGDVGGHGLPAAVVMGEVRQAFRAAAVNVGSPALVLERANAIVNMRENPVMVTALFGIYDRATSAFTYAAAGHPAPILATAQGKPVLLPGGGMPLGIDESIDARDWTIPLPPGALLALYTDGLIELERDVVAGLENLCKAVGAEAAQHEPLEDARAIHDRIFSDRESADDAATLALRIAETVRPTLELSFSAAPFIIPIVRDALRSWCVGMRLNEDDTFGILLATGEALANAVEHAYDDTHGLVRLRAILDDESITVAVEDQGRWKPPTVNDERGRGLPIMHALMDSVDIESDDHRKTIHLRRTITPAE
jgi:anti-sigma regulatory factor (Ser/Thr protein kinase)